MSIKVGAKSMFSMISCIIDIDNDLKSVSNAEEVDKA